MTKYSYFSQFSEVSLPFLQKHLLSGYHYLEIWNGKLFMTKLQHFMADEGLTQRCTHIRTSLVLILPPSSQLHISSYLYKVVWLNGLKGTSTRTCWPSSWIGHRPYGGSTSLASLGLGLRLDPWIINGLLRLQNTTRLTFIGVVVAEATGRFYSSLRKKIGRSSSPSALTVFSNGRWKVRKKRPPCSLLFR